MRGNPSADNELAVGFPRPLHHSPIFVNHAPGLLIPRNSSFDNRSTVWSSWNRLHQFLRHRGTLCDINLSVMRTISSIIPSKIFRHTIEGVILQYRLLLVNVLRVIKSVSFQHLSRHQRGYMLPCELRIYNRHPKTTRKAIEDELPSCALICKI